MTSLNSFRFGGTTVQSLRMVELALQNPAPPRSNSVLSDIGAVVIPELLLFDEFDAESLHVDNVIDRTVHCKVIS